MLNTISLDMWIMRPTLGSNKHKTKLGNGYYFNCILDAGILFKNLLIHQPWWMTHTHTRTHTHTHTHTMLPLLPLSFTPDDQIITCLHQPFIPFIYNTQRKQWRTHSLAHLAGVVTIQWDQCCYIPAFSISTQMQFFSSQRILVVLFIQPAL